MTLVAIYARYSSDLQSDASIEDQIRLCQERATREGMTVVNSYTDHGLSGASMMRPGVQMLMQDAAAGRFDVVLAEALDRLSRDQEDIAGIYKRLQFAGVKILTLSEGEISNLHIGLKGTMNALFLKDLADKTRRGLSGRVLKGKSGGGLTYGYDVVRKWDANGEPIRGEREINETEAAIVRRIFDEYSQGKSPKAIAVQLNKEGVKGPCGRAWGPSTIYGNRRRGTGIINNELYIGKLIWNRLRYIKDPDTGKRVSRLNPESEWLTTDVPEMRIMDQEVWDRVKAMQKDLDDRADGFWQAKRPTYLFSNLLKCGCCGGGMSKVSQSHYGCSTARNKGTCGNRRTIKQDKLEEVVLKALQNHLMDPAHVAVFCEEYTSHMNRLRIEHNAARAGYEAELVKLDKERRKIIDSIVSGVPGELVKDRMIEIGNRTAQLKAVLETTDEAPPLFHPSMAKRYHEEVSALVAALTNDGHRAEAAQLIRALVDKIVLSPDPGSDELLVDLHGDLAGILSVAVHQGRPIAEAGFDIDQARVVASNKDGAKNLKENNGSGIKSGPQGAADDGTFTGVPKLVAGVRNKLAPKGAVKMVAGAGFEPATFRL